MHFFFIVYSYEALVAVKNVSLFGYLTLPWKATITDNKTIYPKDDRNEIQYAYLCPIPIRTRITMWENSYMCLFEESTSTDGEEVTCSLPVQPLLTKRHGDQVFCKEGNINSLLYDFGFYVSIVLYLSEI